jgi:hypothetical protein
VSREDAMLSIWRQVLVEQASQVVVNGETYPVIRTARSRLRQVDFIFEGTTLRGLEQNPATSSRWAKLARQGQKVMQFLEGGRYLAVIADGNIFTYGGKNH